jgi:hypothetical protein
MLYCTTATSRGDRLMSHSYLGRWRIIEMEQWDQDFIDLVVPGYIAFREDHTGEFQFGAVMGTGIIVSSHTTTVNARDFPGKGQTKWTRSADGGGQ